MQGTLVRASKGIMPSPTAYYLVYKAERRVDPAIQIFSNWIRSQIAAFANNVAVHHPAVAFSVKEDG